MFIPGETATVPSEGIRYIENCKKSLSSLDPSIVREHVPREKYRARDDVEQRGRPRNGIPFLLRFPEHRMFIPGPLKGLL